MKKRITENNLIEFLKTILDVEGEISLRDFIERVKNAFDLSPEDLKKSLTRPNEAMYEQKCRNLNCHRNFPTNMISYVNCIFKSRNK